ncbi:MAG: uracil-DNA glycosylase family protein [Longimicrobiales bacterium]|nr:uracil-DNA glycosylase family protein [Longimicrobiales bacterium]
MTRDAFLDHLAAGVASASGTDAGARRAATPTPGPAPTRESEAPAPESEASGSAPDTAPAPGIGTLDYEALRETALGCTRCGLAKTRTRVVFADGTPDARLVVVGEAPGANEDRTGLPFVGAAGKLLDLILASVDLSREDSVYICNVLKCRPPGNRNPNPEEIRACAPFLARQLALVQPEALLAVGTFAAQLLTGRDEPLGKLRGEVQRYEGIPLVVTYHPAALLRNSGWVRPTWDDLQLLRQVMDG